MHELVLIYEKDMLPLHREFADGFCKKKKICNKKPLKLAREKWSKRVRQPGTQGIYLTPPTKEMKFKEGLSTNTTNTRINTKTCSQT